MQSKPEWDDSISPLAKLKLSPLEIIKNKRALLIPQFSPPSSRTTRILEELTQIVLEEERAFSIKQCPNRSPTSIVADFLALKSHELNSSMSSQFVDRLDYDNYTPRNDDDKENMLNGIRHNSSRYLNRENLSKDIEKLSEEPSSPQEDNILLEEIDSDYAQSLLAKEAKTLNNELRQLHKMSGTEFSDIIPEVYL